MRKTLICLLSFLLLVCAVSCEKTPKAPAPEEPAAVRFSPDIPEYRYISIYHYKKNAEGAYESLEDGVSYNVLEGDPNIGIWQELLREIENSEYTPTQTAFDYDEYFDINIYLAGGEISQYALSFSVNGVCDVEQKKCTVVAGGASFARLAEYFAILKG